MIKIENEVSLSNPITNFEAEMFVTTSKHCIQHSSFWKNGIVLVDKGAVVESSRIDDVNCRIKMMSQFNDILSGYGYKISKAANKLQSVTIRLGDESDVVYGMLFSDIIKKVGFWSEKHSRVVALVYHIYDTDKKTREVRKMPHVHILYTRGSEKIPNELKLYLEAVGIDMYG